MSSILGMPIVAWRGSPTGTGRTGAPPFTLETDHLFPTRVAALQAAYKAPWAKSATAIYSLRLPGGAPFYCAIADVMVIDGPRQMRGQVLLRFRWTLVPTAAWAFTSLLGILEGESA